MTKDRKFKEAQKVDEINGGKLGTDNQNDNKGIIKRLLGKLRWMSVLKSKRGQNCPIMT